MFKKLWNDESGIVTLEYLVLATIVGLGLIVGATALRNGLNAELGELAEAITGLNQSYAVAGQSFCGTNTIGFSTADRAGADIAYTAVAANGALTEVLVAICP